MTRPAYTGLTAEEAHELFSYDAETGDFAWKVAKQYSIVVGRPLKPTSSHGYINVRVNGASILVHRLAWLLHYGRWPVDQIDHIDGCKTNNSIANLREATSRQNQFNIVRRGYTYLRNSRSMKKYRAKLKVNGKFKHIGNFATAEEAKAAYIAAANEHRGAFSPGRTL